MPSPKMKRSASGPGAAVANGRFEPGSAFRFRSPEVASRRRSSVAAAQPEDAARLDQSFASIALRALLAIDLWLSKRLAVCACDDSVLGSVRPLVRLVEVSGLAAPWLLAAAYCVVTSGTAAEQEIFINLLVALVLDLLCVAAVRRLVRRRPPAHARSDSFFSFPVSRYCFPSGHAARAAMCGRFLLTHLAFPGALRALVLGWATLATLSPLLLGRHNVTDMAFGVGMGYCQSEVVEQIWVSREWLKDVLMSSLGLNGNTAWTGLSWVL
ncbi:phospholipid phosphatase 6-like [Denticeps clupeoides]|uniref:Polyisoprenoid diphosphate/phosphate phosphohydrolase PLPP6 n=1 Tax=Denticeps clupeoides TaxID=299321 RepID=A0AAY4AW12_9TELE|nr:phospholipid phosphatase 6-like [Denticeps clupeoides]